MPRRTQKKTGKDARIAFDPKRFAMLSMDLQAGIVSMYVKDDTLIPRAADVVAQARNTGAKIIHVKVGFRPNVPEASPRNRLLSAVKSSPRHQQFFQGESGAIHPGIAPAATDLVVTKSRISAFAGTDLDLLLRAHDIESLVMFGVATSGVVLSTALAGLDADYNIFVIGDCCADLDPELHKILLEKFFPRFATVLTAAEFLKAL
jgi:nicotinamidase-related amidase